MQLKRNQRRSKQKHSSFQDQEIKKQQLERNGSEAGKPIRAR